MDFASQQSYYYLSIAGLLFLPFATRGSARQRVTGRALEGEHHARQLTGGWMQLTRDANGNVTTTVYDSLGVGVATVNALGYRTTQVYDAIGEREMPDEHTVGRTRPCSGG